MTSSHYQLQLLASEKMMAELRAKIIADAQAEGKKVTTFEGAGLHDCILIEPGDDDES